MEKATGVRKLPSLSTLFKDSWETFKGSVLHVFIINLIAFGIYTALFVVFLLISVPIGIFSIMDVLKTNSFSPASISSFVIIGIVALIFLAALIIVGIAQHAATILIVANYKKHPAVGTTFKKGFAYVLPVFLVNLFIGFLVLGGYFIFVIPGIFLSILFSFVVYEVVLANNSVLGATRRSMTIVLSNFWGILGRMLLWVIIVISIVNIPNAFTWSSQGYSPSLGGLQFILQILVGWFGISYGVTLYKQAQNAARPGKSKLLWPVIVGVAGWIIGVILLTALITFITTVAIPQFQKNYKPKKTIKNVVMQETKTIQKNNP